MPGFGVFFMAAHGTRRTRTLGTMIALATCLAAAEAGAIPLPLSIQAGAEYSQGANDQTTRSALALGTIGAGGLSVTAGVLRFDDSQVGAGNGFVGGVGVPLFPMTNLRVQGVRFIGDDSFRAWRAKAGPVFSFPMGPTLGVSFVHHQDNQNGRSNGVVGELAIPLPGTLTAQASASHASLSNGLEASSGAIGLGWRPLPMLEISGEAGLARNGSPMTSSSAPPGRTLDLPVLGDAGSGGTPGSTTRETQATEPTFLLGAQIRFP